MHNKKTHEIENNAVYFYKRNHLNRNLASMASFEIVLTTQSKPV